MPNWNRRAKALVEGSPIDERLQDAERRIGLHDAHEAQHRFGRHETVGVQRDREFVVAAPSVAEIADIAGLEARIDRAAPVGDRDPAAALGGERAETGLLGGDDLGIAGVAQEIDMKQMSDARR